MAADGRIVRSSGFWLRSSASVKVGFVAGRGSAAQTDYAPVAGDCSMGFGVGGGRRKAGRDYSAITRSLPLQYTVSTPTKKVGKKIDRNQTGAEGGWRNLLNGLFEECRSLRLLFPSPSGRGIKGDGESLASHGDHHRLRSGLPFGRTCKMLRA